MKKFNNNAWIVLLLVVLAIPIVLLTVFGHEGNTTKTWEQVLDHGITWIGAVIGFGVYMKYRNK